MRYTKKSMIVGGLIGLCIGLFNSLREGGSLNELINSKQLNEPQNEFAQYVPQVDLEKPVSSAKVKSFNILGSELLIPTPPKFFRLPEDHDLTKQIASIEEDPMNDILAIFLPENQLSSFLSNDFEGLSIDKICFAKIYKKMKKVSPKRSLLNETKKGFEEQGDQIMSKLRGTISDFYDKRSKTISKEYDIEMVMKVSDFVFLPLHEESENHFSMSLLAKMELNGLSEVVSATMSMCYTKKTIPQVVVRGSKDDLEWTRLVCSQWTKEMLEINY